MLDSYFLKELDDEQVEYLSLGWEAEGQRQTIYNRKTPIDISLFWVLLSGLEISGTFKTVHVYSLLWN